MPRVSSGRQHAHYTEAGTGSPVVMLHSGGMSSRQWGRLSARLAPKYRALAMDFLGYGDSAPAGDSFTIADDLDAAIALVDSLGEPAHVVGHSYGGLIALSLTRARPSNVRSLAVYEPVAFGVLHSMADAEGLADLGAYGGDSSFGEEPGSERWIARFVEYWNGVGAWDALPAPTRDAFLRVAPKVYLEVAGILTERTPHDAYRAIAAPTLVMTGERSTTAARHVAAILAQVIPDAELQTIEGAGHMGPLTHADIVNGLIEAHLSR